MCLGKSKVVYKVYETEQERNKTKKTLSSNYTIFAMSKQSR